ncbi:MAG: hypothetical protein HMLIMOIP_000656 [Candidatus Nitrosomirales archaeon]|jgi:hypothetical protein
MFGAWIVGYDVQYNRLTIDKILEITRYYFTCEKWFFSYNTPPCLNGHTAGWDMIPVTAILGGLALIIYALISKPKKNIGIIR